MLVLGSLPGEMSLAKSEYYGNPQNQFWRLIGGVIDVDLDPKRVSYADRLAALAQANVGLWDVVKTATRPGSLDSAIRDHAPNALPDLAAALPNLRAIGFNGGTSWKLGSPQLAASESLALIPLPSSSPAYTRPFAEKLGAWMALKGFL